MVETDEIHLRVGRDSMSKLELKEKGVDSC